MLKAKPISYRDTTIKSGFWYKRQQINAQNTLESVYRRFEETGRFAALRCNGSVKPHIFWDSDVAKWMEGAAYLLAKAPNPALEEKMDRLIDTIAEHQEQCGYFNSYFQVEEPEQKFCRRTDHELYCAGHLMEAAVAYQEATGKDQFLKMMCRYADYIEKKFKLENSAKFTTPGHEEIELALVRLYHATGEKRYLDLSLFFINQRGQNGKDLEKFYDFANAKYTQDHLPVREQTTAEGHAVRAVYLYCAMADLAMETNDQALLSACKTIFSNITGKRMYVTGSIGSTAEGEAFTYDYDLPNLTAYAETCAALGLALFGRRMSLSGADALYGDTVERALYNGFLSGVSLDGKSFFYENPLEIDPRLHQRNSSTKTAFRLPIMQRKEVFDCSCCPPNVLRLIASLGDFLYSQTGDTLFVHHYMDSETHTVGADIRQQTSYPSDGEVFLRISGGFSAVALRIPGWCTDFTLDRPYTLKDGYAYITKSETELTLRLHLSMPVCLVESSPNVPANSGRVAVMRGPVVYCAEGLDNGENLRDLRVDARAGFMLSHEGFAIECGVPLLKTTAYRRPAFQELYRPLEDSLIPQELTLIPYFAFANRGVSEMLVWLQRL